MKNVCFTGHREAKQEDVIPELEKVVEELAINGAENFYAGGAVGWDTICELTVLRLRKKYPNIKLNLILPCSREEQTAKWTSRQIRDYDNILKQADSVEYIADKYYNGCMKDRNKRLVEEADCCVCYLNKQHLRSGTGQTYGFALKKGIKIINLWTH